ncbi:MAG: hypothetical protein AAF565_07345, partial [Pseudomonadota bacterium]
MFEVTTGLDVVDAADGVLSLREAIALAAAAQGPDTIFFAPFLEQITVDSTLQITDPELSINGADQSLGADALLPGVTLFNNHSGTLFHVLPSADLTLRSVEVRSIPIEGADGATATATDADGNGLDGGDGENATLVLAEGRFLTRNSAFIDITLQGGDGGNGGDGLDGVANPDPGADGAPGGDGGKGGKGGRAVLIDFAGSDAGGASGGYASIALIDIIAIGGNGGDGGDGGNGANGTDGGDGVIGQDGGDAGGNGFNGLPSEGGDALLVRYGPEADFFIQFELAIDGDVVVAGANGADGDAGEVGSPGVGGDGFFGSNGEDGAPAERSILVQFIGTPIADRDAFSDGSPGFLRA